MGLQFQLRLLAVLCLPAMARAQELAERTVSADINKALSNPGIHGAPAELPELRAESAIYLQRRLGVWQEADAKKILGEPRRQREALEQGTVTGAIQAFADPTSRYREFELLFDRQTKAMRAVYIYPWHMTWSECRQLWGGDVNSTRLANGNLFHSYRTRRLDVLVDKTGAVINLGIY
jgi:hypothetical protein